MDFPIDSLPTAGATIGWAFVAELLVVAVGFVGIGAVFKKIDPHSGENIDPVIGLARRAVNVFVFIGVADHLSNL